MLDPDISTADAMALLHRPETDPWAVDRRRFLQLVGMGAGAGLVAGGTSSLLDELFLGHDPSAWAAGPVGPRDGILVVIGMYGGNDGLNTVVPITDGRYYDQHGGLALAPGATLPIDARTGLNPNLTELKRFWDRGELAIVEGIGYPNPDLSHFNSMAYWMAAQPGGVPMTGWLGRWLDGHLGGARDLYAAAEIGNGLPLHLVGSASQGTTVPPRRPGFGADDSPRSLRKYAALRSMRSTARGPWVDAVSSTFVDTLDLAANLSPFIPDTDDLPDTDIVARLEVAARLINANLGFRVVTAGWGDFDSHAGQPAMHRDRMVELNTAVERFFEVLDEAWATRVTVMTFSEFGRTSWDNDGAGSDHGTAAPHFVFGRNVKGGFYGQRPSLAGLGRWDRMPYHVDFRSYYASIIDGWLGGGSSDVLGGNYENLRLFRRGPGLLPDGSVAPGPAKITPPSGLTPITPARICDTRDGTGGVPRRPIGAGTKLRVKVLGVGGVPSSGVTAVAANVTAVRPTEVMYFTVSPGSTARPNTSNLNGAPGRPIPNLVVMGVGDDGCIDVFNSHGTTHCIVDVFGYFREGTGDRFTPLAPRRLFDTRSGVGIRPGKLRHLVPVDIQVAGKAGVPASGASAVVLNLTATAPEAPGFLRLSPTGGAVAKTSNVNFHARDVVPNLVVCKLGTGGRLTIDASGPGTHAIGDVFGYFGAGGSRMQTTPPRRLLDTRSGYGAEAGKVGSGRTIRLRVAGRESVPLDATAAILNVTGVRVDRRSYLVVHPDGEAMPGTSNLNLVPGPPIANLVICRLGEEGALQIANPEGNCDVVVDVLGFFVD